jgi:hypothetical protein
MARAMLADATLEHAAKVIARHVRLVATHPERWSVHPRGTLFRQLALLVRAARLSSKAPRPPRRVSNELLRLAQRLEESAARKAQDDAVLYKALESLWDRVA